MYLTFATESQYGIDATSQEYVVDLISEAIIDNLQYEKTREFNHPTSQSRYKKVKTVDGRIELEMTYNNKAWSILFEALMGQRIELDGFALAPSSEKWQVMTGMLEADLTASATSFNITEYKTGEFDNVDGVIINNEYIAVSAIANGNVTSSTRASEGTTAVYHNQNALVYGVQVAGGSYLDIISRYKSGYCYYLPKSLTFVLYRDGDYFCFNGVKFEDFVFNARPLEGVESSFMIKGRDGKIISLESPSTTVDNNLLLDTDHMGCYCMGEGIDVAKIYIEISNTLDLASPKMLDSTITDILLRRFSAYGQFTAVEETIQFYEEYKSDEIKNLSLAICNSKNFSNAYVFSFNDIKWGTIMHVLRNNLFIDDSIPFYCYGENAFNIIIQR